jgi:pimeloyl-ACP methyl ester carboxylesterase
MPVSMVAGKNDVLDSGENDSIAQLSGEMALFAIIAAKNTKLQIISFANGGHFVYREHPVEFNALLTTCVGHSTSNPTDAPGEVLALPN